jgi:hypothetical protein
VRSDPRRLIVMPRSAVRLLAAGAAFSKRKGFLGICTKLSGAPALTGGEAGSRRYVALIVARNLLTSCLR